MSLCSQGYFLDNNSNCSSCLPNCSECTNQRICLSCTGNLNLSSDNTTYCLICDQNSSLSNGLCNPIVAQSAVPSSFPAVCPQNCLTCSNPQTCITCASQFTLTPNNICVPCPLNCFECNPLGTCLYCMPGYFPDGNNPQVCLVCTPNCQSCNSSNTCLALVPKIAKFAKIAAFAQSARWATL